MYRLKEITPAEMEDLVNRWESRHFYSDELLYCYDNGKWIGCDNTDGNCWVEEFSTEVLCQLWLVGIVDSEGAFVSDDVEKHFVPAFFEMAEHIAEFEDHMAEEVLTGIVGKDIYDLL